MSDTADYSSVTAAQARVVFSGVYTTNVTGNVPVALLQTDRSLIILCNGINQTMHMGVVGATTGCQYGPGAGNSSGAGWGWACPAYGAADPVVNFSLTENVSHARNVTIIACPDEISSGQLWAPTFVELCSGQQPILTAAGGLAVGLIDTLSFPLGIDGNPLRADPAPGVDTASLVGVATGTQANILAAPAAGNMWEVDFVSAFPVANSTAAQRLSVLDVASGNEMGGWWVPVGGTPSHCIPRFRASGAVAGVNHGIGVGANFACMARQVPTGN